MCVDVPAATVMVIELNGFGLAQLLNFVAESAAALQKSAACLLYSHPSPRDRQGQARIMRETEDGSASPEDLRLRVAGGALGTRHTACPTAAFRPPPCELLQAPAMRPFVIASRIPTFSPDALLSAHALLYLFASDDVGSPRRAG